MGWVGLVRAVTCVSRWGLPVGVSDVPGATDGRLLGARCADAAARRLGRPQGVRVARSSVRLMGNRLPLCACWALGLLLCGCWVSQATAGAVRTAGVTAAHFVGA